MIRKDILDHRIEALIGQVVVSEIQRSWPLQLGKELVEEEVDKCPLATT